MEKLCISSSDDEDMDSFQPYNRSMSSLDDDEPEAGPAPELGPGPSQAPKQASEPTPKTPSIPKSNALSAPSASGSKPKPKHETDKETPASNAKLLKVVLEKLSLYSSPSSSVLPPTSSSSSNKEQEKKEYKFDAFNLKPKPIVAAELKAIEDWLKKQARDKAKNLKEKLKLKPLDVSKNKDKVPPKSLSVEDVQNLLKIRTIQYTIQSSSSRGVPPSIPPKHQDVPYWLRMSSAFIGKQLEYVEAKASPEMSPPFDIVDDEILGYMKPIAKILSSKWFELFAHSSMNNLRRSLILTALPTSHDQRMLAGNCIMRRTVKLEALPIYMKFTNIYCTLNLNTTLILQDTARSLKGAVYKNHIDVIQHTFDNIRLAWIWADGTLMIINGVTQPALIEIQTKLMKKLSKKLVFKPEPSHKAQYLRLISYAQYPWAINLREFCDTEALRRPLHHERYVYYVIKDLPGVVARIHESGQVCVFAMHLIVADKMLAELYTVASKYRVTPF